jgi:hypothetical protein
VVDEKSINIAATIAFLLVYAAGSGYGCYLAWFRFEKLRARFFKRYEHGSGTPSSDWAYKWSLRIVMLVLTSLGGGALVIALYSLLRTYLG